MKKSSGTAFLCMILLFVPLLLISGYVRAGDPGMRRAGGSSYYQKHGEGWFWYQDPPEEPEAPDEEPLPPLPEPPAVSGTSVIPPPEYSADGLYAAAYLKKALPLYLERALDAPTPENVRAYFELQKMSMDKSQNFAGAAKLMPLLHPELDESRGRADYGRGRELQDRMAEEAREQDLRRISERAGLFFLYRSSCPYCREALREVERLRGYGFQVLGISLDQGLLPVPGAIRNVSDPAMAGVLGITSVPALVLAAPGTDRQYVTVSASLLSPRETENRIVAAGRLLGVLENDDEYK